MASSKLLSLVPRINGETGLRRLPCLAAGNSDHSSKLFIVPRIERCFGLSPELAAAVVCRAGPDMLVRLFDHDRDTALIAIRGVRVVLHKISPTVALIAQSGCHHG